MMGLDNPIHLAFLLIVVLLVFGAKRLPEMGHSLGSGLRGFKEAIGSDSVHTSPSMLEKQTHTTPEHVPAPATSAPPLTSVRDDRSA